MECAPWVRILAADPVADACLAAHGVCGGTRGGDSLALTSINTTTYDLAVWLLLSVPGGRHDEPSWLDDVGHHEIVWKSAAMRRVMAQVDRVARDAIGRS